MAAAACLVGCGSNADGSNDNNGAVTGAGGGVTVSAGAGGSAVAAGGTTASVPPTGSGGAAVTPPSGGGGTPVGGGGGAPVGGGGAPVVGAGGAAPSAGGALGMGVPPTDGWTVKSNLDASGELIAPATGVGFQIATPVFDLQPGQEVFKCFHVALPNKAEFPVGEWESQMTAGSHHFILYSPRTPRRPAGR